MPEITFEQYIQEETGAEIIDNGQIIVRPKDLIIEPVPIIEMDGALTAIRDNNIYVLKLDNHFKFSHFNTYTRLATLRENGGILLCGNSYDTLKKCESAIELMNNGTIPTDRCMLERYNDLWPILTKLDTLRNKYFS